MRDRNGDCKALPSSMTAQVDDGPRKTGQCNTIVNGSRAQDKEQVLG